MGQWVTRWVMGHQCDGSDGSWVTNVDPWSTLMGTRDVAETVPKGSFIDVAEFNTPDDVASYLQLVLDNETLYNSYLEWKYKPFDPEHVRKNIKLQLCRQLSFGGTIFWWLVY